MDHFSDNLDFNTCLTKMGSQISDVFTRSGLLISEDMAFIDTLIDSELDFQSNKECLKPKFNLSFKHISAVVLTTSGLIWFESSLTSYRPFFGSIVCGVLWKLSSDLYKLVYKIYSKQRLLNKSIDLSKRLTKESDLIKKYFKLIEDYEAVEDNGKHLTKICEMKDKFRIFCWNRFIRFREITINLRQIFRLNSEIDEEINYLCCFPIETFDKFITEDKSVINVSSLKSLMHLKRLQQSECFRRIICLFMTICLEKQNTNSTTDQIIKRIIKHILKVFESLIEESIESYPQFLSEYKCAKSLWISSEKSLIKYRDLKETNQTIEIINLLNTNRNIRKHLLTSLNILDDCDSLIEDGIQTNHFRNQFRQQINSISDEFKSLNDLIINLEKILRIEELKETKSLSITKWDKNNDNSKSPINSTKFEDYVVKDQVFEAIVTEECDENDSIDLENDDQLWEMRLKLSEESDTSNCLFKELKVALKSKAVEHKKREAKALGLQFDEICEHSDENSDQSLEENQNLFNSSTNLKVLDSEIEKQNNSMFSSNFCGFESQMAITAAQKARHFALTQQTENFGDDSDSETE